MMSKEKTGSVSMGQIKKNCRLIIVLTAILSLGGCLSLARKTPSFFYYTLEYAAPQTPGLKPLDTDIYVERFVANPPYDTDRMIYRPKRFERDAYLYHRWRTRPAEMVSSLLARDLRKSRAFHRVYREFLPPRTAYLLQGVVEDFLEWDSSHHGEALLRLRIILSSTAGPGENEESLFEKTYVARKPLEGKGPRDLARAMSQALKEISGLILQDIHHVLETRQSARQE